MKMNHNQAPGGTAKPNGNEFKGKGVSVRKPDDGGIRSGVKVPGHSRGKQGKG